jgi:phosphoribosylglycinamide formyltransferase-1
MTHIFATKRKKALRVAVFISGRGSNLAALLKAAEAPNYPAEIVLVLSNRPDAPGLSHARRYGISTAVVDHKQFGTDRAAFESKIHDTLLQYRVEFVCLAGFMRLLTSWFISRWETKILNIHPALLPAFPGLHTHERAIQKKVSIHGASVHFVTAEMDRGPILARVPIHVRNNDTPESLAHRLLRIEHHIYPAALKLVAEGRVKIKDGHCYVDGNKINGRILFYVSKNKRVVFKNKNAFKFENMKRKAAEPLLDAATS